MSTEADPYPTTRQRLAQGFLALVGVCVLYAASSGPMWVLHCSTGFPSLRVLVVIYAPLKLVAEKTSTDGYYHAYQEWWYYSCRPKGGYEGNNVGL